MILILDIWLLQTVAFAFVLHEKQEGYEDGYDAEAGEDGHRLCVVDGAVCSCVGLVHFTNPHGNKGETDVLDVEDECIGGTEKLHRDNLRNGGPHG